MKACHCDQYEPSGWSTRTTGKMWLLPVWIRVRTSNPSSCVPNPPGNRTIASVSFTNISLRVKKYRIVISLSLPVITGLADCSNGSRMFSPMLASRPAPTCPASVPPPAPVTIIHPSAAIRRPNSIACWYVGWSGFVRADPNTVTFRFPLYLANTLKQCRSSLNAVARSLTSPRVAPSTRSLSAASLISRTKSSVVWGRSRRAGEVGDWAAGKWGDGGGAFSVGMKGRFLEGGPAVLPLPS